MCLQRMPPLFIEVQRLSPPTTLVVESFLSAPNLFPVHVVFFPWRLRKFSGGHEEYCGRMCNISDRTFSEYGILKTPLAFSGELTGNWKQQKSARHA